METKTITCQNKDKSKYCMGDFEITPDDFTFYEKIQVPPPTFCPECRRQQRFSWRNFTHYYRKPCFLTGNTVLTLYSPESKVRVIESSIWHSDRWDAKEYAKTYDFSKSFFEQYVDLLKTVPRPAMDTDDGLVSKNCPYTNDFAMGKDCYLVVKAWKLENVMYSFYVVNGKDLVDVHTSFGKDEANYETVNTKQCYRCRNIIDSRSCSECLFSFDLRNCSNCFLCSGLRGKSYCYKNKEVGKEKYEEILNSYNLSTYSGTEKALLEFNELVKSHPRKPLRMVNCNNCFGDLIFNSHNCLNCFCLLDSENAKYCTFADGTKDAMDSEACGGSELIYQSDLPAFCSNIICSYSVWNSQNLFYCSAMYRSSDCFGCSGLKDSKYCILNKQYSKEEYLKFVELIKKHMKDLPYVDSMGNTYAFGDFLPIELSYFGYNDSVASELLYPLTSNEIRESGFFYQDNQYRDLHNDTISFDSLPDNIKDVSDDILDKVITSKSSGRQYKITEQELFFYRKYSIPLPRESFYDRYHRRLRDMTTFRIFKSKSVESGKDIYTYINPQDNFPVLTEEEYKKYFE